MHLIPSAQAATAREMAWQSHQRLELVNGQVQSEKQPLRAYLAPFDGGRVPGSRKSLIVLATRIPSGLAS